MPEKTFRKATMFLDLDGRGACQPLADYVRPAKSHRHQSQQFLKSFFLGDMRFFQTKATRLQTTEQVLDLPSLGIVAQYLFSFRAACHNHIFALWSSHPHQRNFFRQDFSLTTEQHSDTGFLCAKE